MCEYLYMTPGYEPDTRVFNVSREFIPLAIISPTLELASISLEPALSLFSLSLYTMKNNKTDMLESQI